MFVYQPFCPFVCVLFLVTGHLQMKGKVMEMVSWIGLFIKLVDHMRARDMEKCITTLHAWKTSLRFTLGDACSMGKE